MTDSTANAIATQKLHFYQKGTFTVGNRLVSEARAIGAGLARPLERADLRASRLPGMRRGAGRALRHRRGDARHRRQPDRGQRDRLPGSLHHALSGNLVANAVAAFAVRQCRGGRHRRRRGHAGEGTPGGARDRPGRRRRHHRYRLWLPVRDVRAQRRRALHLLRQRRLHEHRRAALLGDAADGAHGDHAGRGPGARQRLRHRQESAEDRRRARHSLCRHRDRRRPA